MIYSSGLRLPFSKKDCHHYNCFVDSGTGSAPGLHIENYIRLEEAGGTVDVARPVAAVYHSLVAGRMSID